MYLLFLDELDLTPPTVTVTLDDTLLIAGETATVTFTFSEPVVGFTADDVTVGNGSLSGLAVTGNPSVCTATFTPMSNLEDATNVITLDRTGVTEGAGNAGTGTTDSNNYAIDSARPTVTVNIVDAVLNDADTTSQVTIEFSEAVSGFDVSDVSVIGGTLSEFTMIDADSFTVTFTADDGVEATGLVRVGTGYTDAAGNSGTAGSDNVRIDTRAAGPVTVNLPGAGGSSEVLLNAGDIVVRIAGGAELLRRRVLNTSQLTLNGSAQANVVTVLNTGTRVSIPITFLGNDRADRFDGKLATGSLNLSGGLADDTLLDGTGPDTLRGDAGNDRLVGGNENDLIQGGDGADVAVGGNGIDPAAAMALALDTLMAGF